MFTVSSSTELRFCPLSRASALTCVRLLLAHSEMLFTPEVRGDRGLRGASALQRAAGSEGVKCLPPCNHTGEEFVSPERLRTEGESFKVSPQATEAEF